VSGAWQVAARELRERGKSKAYLITSGLILLIVVALVVVPRFLDKGTDVYAFGLVGEGNGPILAAVEQLANASDLPDEPPSVAVEITEYETRAAAEADLSDGTLDAVLVDGDEVITKRAAGFGGSPLIGLLQRGAASVDLNRIVAEEGEAATDVIEVMTSDPLTTTTLTGEDADDESGGVAAYAGLLLLYLAILVYGTWILTGVTEEKSNRVVEVLLSSLRPRQLLVGKILGIGVLGISQFAGTVIVAVAAIELSGAYDIPAIGARTVFNLILWFVLGFAIFACMFGAAGSLVSRQEDAQSIAMPMTLSAVAGFFLSTAALTDPEGLPALIGTFIPITAPFVVPVRASLNALPLWQHAVSAAAAVAAVVALASIGGRIYAGGVLRYGKKVRVREAWRSADE